MKKVTKGFELLMTETNGVGPAFMEAISKMAEKSALDKKTHELAYISVLVATKMYGGLPFHIQQAIQLGASTQEIKSAMLLPMPIIGIQVGDALEYLKEFAE
jgi:alkylhydroperoxidase/carboxymuconolactone decarboxylase family protein YurZ